MGTYYYIEDPDNNDQLTPGMRVVYEDDYISAIYSVAKKHGVKITDKMILEELDKPCQKPKKERH